jgi:hypothetical protein
MSNSLVNLNRNEPRAGTGKMSTYLRHPDYRRLGFISTVELCVFAALSAAASQAVTAAPATVCTLTEFCYCINSDFRSAIDHNIQRLRRTIADQKSQGKAIGYMSIPLSTVAGGYFAVNAEVAGQTKRRVEQRFGADSLWLLNPASPENNLPRGATGADYMYTWTQILEGKAGLGEDFDLVYFVGPSEFASFFALTGHDDMKKIDHYFDRRLRADAELRKLVVDGTVNKIAFRNYYALRASVSFSKGAHDEWNIVRIINERRRGSGKFGIANQLPILFDGHAVPASDFNEPVASGETGRCTN